MGSSASVFRMSMSRVPWTRSLGLSAMEAFLLRVKRKHTLLLLIVKRRVGITQSCQWHGLARGATYCAPRSSGDYKYRLFDLGKGTDLGLERLVVLPLDLQLGLEFLDQQFQARNFHTKFLQIMRGSRGPCRSLRV